MTDTGPIAAKPKELQPQLQKTEGQQFAIDQPVTVVKRGPGRPPKPESADPFTVMTMIASALRTVDKPHRRQILETLLAMSE